MLLFLAGAERAAFTGAACKARPDGQGDHRAACLRSGRLKRRARFLECVWTRVLREAGARVVERFGLRDTRVLAPPHDSRCIEILAMGLPLFGGIPLAVDATMASALHVEGTPWAGTADTDGVALERAEQAGGYPELVHSSVVRLVIVATDTEGRWSPASLKLSRGLTAYSTLEVLRGVASGAWWRLWVALLSVAQQRALADTLVDTAQVELDGFDGDEPLGCVRAEDLP